MEPRIYRVIPPEPNKRRFPRVRWSDAVQLYSGNNRFQGALSCDISGGGLRLKSAEFLPVNSDVRMFIRLDTEKTLECKGKVMWISRVPFAQDDQFHIGVAFDPKSLSNQEYNLKDFLSSNLKKA